MATVLEPRSQGVEDDVLEVRVFPGLGKATAGVLSPLFRRRCEPCFGYACGDVVNGVTEQPVEVVGKLVRSSSELLTQPIVEAEAARVPVAARLALVTFVAMGQARRPVGPQQQSVDVFPRVGDDRLTMLCEVLADETASVVGAERPADDRRLCLHRSARIAV